MSDRFEIEIIKEEMHAEKKYMEWKMQNFYQRQTVDTEPFSFIGRKWYVEISSRHYQGTYISMFLHSKDEDSSPFVTHTLGIKYLGREIKQVTGTHTFTPKCGYGRQTLYRFQNFLELCGNESKINLTAYCYLEYHNTEHADAECQTALCSITALSRNFEDLFASGQQSDVTIEVHDQQFKAHKSILVARSPVFAAMFSHDMSEKNVGIIRIEDCNPAAFHHFLQCMYTGSVKYASTDNLISLYTAADKYGVTDLKEACLHFIMAELSVDNACDFLVLADKHNETQMKAGIEEFLIKNMKKIVATTKWKSLMSEHSSLAQDILIKLCSYEFRIE